MSASAIAHSASPLRALCWSATAAARAPQAAATKRPRAPRVFAPTWPAAVAPRCGFASCARRRAGKKRTVKLEDLPTAAVDEHGQPLAPLAPLPREQETGTRRRKAAKKKQAEAQAAAAEGAQEGEEVATTEQGPAFARIHELGEEGKEWPPLAKEVLTNLARFPGCILLTRVGNFYESYFEQAPELAQMLGIKLARRWWGGREVAMAGFPVHQMEKYLKILVQDYAKLVAICDEFKEYRATGAGAGAEANASAAEDDYVEEALRFNELASFRRKVTRVVSPGTLIDEKFLDQFSSNFIVSVAAEASTSAGSGLVAGEGAAVQYGLAWLDIGTANFHSMPCSDAQSLRDQVARIAPKEAILHPGVVGGRSGAGGTGDIDRHAHPLWEALPEGSCMVTFALDDAPEQSAVDAVAALPPSIGAGLSSAESRAVQQLTRYIETRLIEAQPEAGDSAADGGTGSASGGVFPLRPQRMLERECMQIDAHTLSALEIRSSMREGGVRGSLISAARRTVTRGGTRLLEEWLTCPSTSLKVIQWRHRLVSALLNNKYLRDDLRLILRRSAGDVSRTLQKMLARRSDEQDLLSVRDFVHLCEKLQATVRESVSRAATPAATDQEREDAAAALELAEQLLPLSHLAQKLEDAIDESVLEKRAELQNASADHLEHAVAMGDLRSTRADHGEVQVDAPKKRGKKAKADETAEESPYWGPPLEHLIRPGASKAIDTLLKEYNSSRRAARRIESKLRDRLPESDRRKLTLRQLLGQGYVVHISDFKERMEPLFTDDMAFAYKSKSTRTFYFEEWTRIGSKLTRLQNDLRQREQAALEALRQMVAREASAIRHNARVIDQLDVLLGFAQLAQEMSLVRPQVDESTDFEVVGGRHLSVEMGLFEQQRRFVKNNLHMQRESRLHLITGPNMGGKSTFVRQNALISILAQSGSFVPAESARIGIVDRLFSRVGAKDDLFRDRSTFMVEMSEMSEILHRATPRSFVIADEIGRGTATAVGTAIAYATLLHLLNATQCRALFATHFHELADMLGYSDDPAAPARTAEGVAFYCTDVIPTQNGDVMYDHKLQPGVNRESHGLAVARLANMPERVIADARRTLAWLEQKAAPLAHMQAPVPMQHVML